MKHALDSYHLVFVINIDKKIDGYKIELKLRKPTMLYILYIYMYIKQLQMDVIAFGTQNEDGK